EGSSMRLFGYFNLALFVLFAAGPSHAAPSFQVVVWNDFVSADLSADGSTVGYAEASADARAGFFDVATGTRTNLVTGRGGVSTPVLSSDGSIIQGTYSDGGDALYEYRNGVLDDLGPTTWTPTALSAVGDVSVGSLSTTMAGRRTGGVSGPIEDLGDLAGGATLAVARDVSGNGQIVVGESESGLGTEAFRWQAGQILGLGDLAGGGFGSSAWAISTDGSTIVGAGTSSAGVEAALWSGMSVLGLGDLPGGDFASRALGVSADGGVVVGSGSIDGGESAFIWDQGSGMRELSTVLAGLGLDLGAVELRRAVAISDDGRTIVGLGFEADIFSETSPDVIPGRGNLVWVATIPEPTTGLLLGLGLAALSARRRAS
ncbi:MAG: PEP-CTERM sorting domain-containing protein, partial [Phycisphaerales bacterium]|nr:PEP-CTERM sorting domain-containing protein [Phycisphaerales bacterium]